MLNRKIPLMTIPCFLTQRSRYDFLFDLPKDDYKAWARGLKKAGYATDRKYPKKLISLIERYQLYKFDDETATKTIEEWAKIPEFGEPVDKSEEAVKIIQVIEVEEREIAEIPSTYHIVKQGDTLYSISKQYQISLEELKTINKLPNNTIEIGQQLKIKH